MTDQTKTKTEKQSVHLLLPDAASTAESAINRAIEFCAARLRVSDYGVVIERLCQHDARACEYCQYSLAQQVGAALGALDEHVKAVYVLDYDATPEDVVFGQEPETPLIHMILRVERKTNALKSLIDALDRALMQAYAQILGATGRQHLLDVQIVTEDEVSQRRGYGAMLSSIHQRPLCIWER